MAVFESFEKSRPDIPALNTDREKLRQIILNLLDNAVKFTERGEIKIAASQQNGSLKLVVSDTGIGIQKEELNKIFEEFHRGDSSSTKNYRGTGLGLAIVKKFVNLLGGEVAVESEVGKGSVFTVTLPLDLSRVSRTAETPEDAEGSELINSAWSVYSCLRVFAACANFSGCRLSGIHHSTKDFLTTKVAKDTKIG